MRAVGPTLVDETGSTSPVQHAKVMMPTMKKTKQTVRPSPVHRQRDRRTASGPTENDIARRAYQLFVERGGEHGRDLEDWLSAKRELLSSDQ